MKNLSRVILLVLAMALVLALASCDFVTNIFGGEDKPAEVDAQAVLNSYLLEQDGKTVSSDFVLPKQINGNAVTWASDNAAVTLEEREEDYLAKIVLPEDRADVTLTVKLGDASKSFTVSVNPIDVYNFLDSYNFVQDKQTISDSFALDTSCTFKGYTANIAWSIAADYTDYAEISEDGKTCVIYPNSLNPTVVIKATFSYKGASATKTFRFTVSLPMTDLETIDYWYNNTGVSVDMHGYIITVATAYNATFNNVSLYVVDESLKAGYYIYRVSIDPTSASVLAPGNYITITGTTNTEYNGLTETNQGGTAVVDASKTIDIKNTVYPIDNDLFANSPAVKYNESRLASLSGWTVTEISEKVSAGTNADLAILEKNGAKVVLRITKYLEGVYLPNADDATWTGIAGLQDTLKVGDVVNVTGLFSKYLDNWQIMPFSAADVVVTTADPAETEYIGLKAKDKIAEVLQFVEENGLKSLITSNTEVTLPASDETVTVSYRLCSSSQAVVINGNTMTITPDKAEKVNVEVTFTCGTYSTVYYFKINTNSATDTKKVEYEAKEVAIDNLPSGTHTLSITPKVYSDVTFTFAPAEGFESLVSFNGNIMSLTSVEAATPVSILVTAHCGEESYTATLNFTIKAPSFTKYTVVTDPVVGTAYKFGLYQKNISSWLFATGKMDGSFGGADADYTKGADFMLETAEGGYYLACTVGGVKKYANLNANGDYSDFSFDDTPSSVWTWNTDHNTLITYVGGHTNAAKDSEYYCGTYKTNKTISSSLASYLSSCDIEGATSFCSKFYIIEEDNTDAAGRALAEKNAFTVEESYSSSALISNIATQYQDVIISFALAEVSEYASIDEKGCLVIGSSTEDYTVHLNVTFTCGTNVEQGSYEIKFVAPSKDGMPIVGVAYKFFVNQLNLQKKLYANGSFDERYLCYTEDPSKAADFVIEKVTGGYKIGTKNTEGETVYVEYYKNKNNKDSLRLSETGSVWEWNADILSFTTTLSGTAYYIGTFDSNDSIRASELSFITGDNASKIGVSQFIAEFAKVAPETGKELLIAVDQNNTSVAKTLYISGTKDSNFFGTTENAALAAKVTIEAVEGGYRFFFMDGETKKYFDIYEYTTGKVGTEITETPVAVYTWNALYGIFTAHVLEDDYYLGTYGTSVRLSASKTSYIFGENFSTWGVSQFPAYFCDIPADLMTPEGKVAAEKDAFTIPEAITAETVISNTSAAYSDVVITIALAEENDNATITDGVLTLAAADKDYTVTIDVTFTCGEVTDTKSFTVAYTAPIKYEMPLVGVAYKFGTYQKKNGKYIYADGTFGDRFLNSTDDISKAVDFYLIAAEGGYYITMYDEKATELKLEVYSNTSSKICVKFSETGSIFNWNANLGVFTTVLGDKTYFIGTYSTYTTLSASELSFIDGDNASKIGDSQFVTELAKAAPETGKELLLAVDQNNASVAKTLYVSGAKDGNYFGTTDNAALAVKVTVEAVEGGYRFFFMDGETKKYFDIYEYTTGKVGVEITQNPVAVYTWNKMYGLYTAHVLEDDYYLGTYGTSVRLSASKTSYIFGDKFSTWGVSQFPAYFCDIPAAEKTDAEKVAAEKDTLTLKATVIKDESIALPAAGTVYEDVAITWEVVTGTCAVITDGNLVITAPTTAEDITVCATIACGEETDTKEFTIHAEKISDTNDADHPFTVAQALALAKTLKAGEYYESKIYLKGIVSGPITKSVRNSINQRTFILVDAATDTEGLLIFKLNLDAQIPDLALGDEVVVSGYLQNYNSTLEITYSGNENPALVSLTHGTVAVTSEGDNATVTVAETAVNASTLTFTVAPADGYEIVSVKVYGTVIVPEDEIYSVTVEGPVNIVVTTKASGEENPVNITLTFPDENSTANKSGSYTDTWTAKNGDQEFTVNAFNNNNWNNEWTYIKCGRKTDDSVASISTTFAEKVTKVTLTVNTILKTDAVNSIKLEVKDSKGNVLETISADIKTGDLVFNLTKSDKNCTYTIIIDNAAHGSKNGNVAISAVHYEA